MKVTRKSTWISLWTLFGETNCRVSDEIRDNNTKTIRAEIRKIFDDFMGDFEADNRLRAVFEDQSCSTHVPILTSQTEPRLLHWLPGYSDLSAVKTTSHSYNTVLLLQINDNPLKELYCWLSTVWRPSRKQKTLHSTITADENSPVSFGFVIAAWYQLKNTEEEFEQQAMIPGPRKSTMNDVSCSLSQGNEQGELDSSFFSFLFSTSFRQKNDNEKINSELIIKMLWTTKCP